MDAGGERDLGPAAVQRGWAVGGQLGEELGDLGLVGGGRGLLGPPAPMAREGGVDAADVACAPRMHPHAALVAADHLLAVVERDAAGAVHRPRAVDPVIGGIGGWGWGRRRRRRGEMSLRRLRTAKAAALHRRRARETLNRRIDVELSASFVLIGRNGEGRGHRRQDASQTEQRNGFGVRGISTWDAGIGRGEMAAASSCEAARRGRCGGCEMASGGGGLRDGSAAGS